MSQATMVGTTENVPTDQLLGYLVFQNIDEVRIHKDDLGKLFDQHNLSRDFLPHEIKPHDAYRRATSRLTGTVDIQVNRKSQTARLLVREVKSDEKQVVRHLVREIVDSKNEVLDYATVGKMTYSRLTKQIYVSWNGFHLEEYDYKRLLQDVEQLFQDWTEYHTKDTVRNIVNRIIGSTNPVSIQKGGRATFIPKNARDTVMNLKEMVADLPGNSSTLQVLPLIDTEDVRDMVAQRVEESMQGEIQDLLDNFTDILSRKSTISDNQLKYYMGKFIQLQSRTQEYQQLVHRKLEAIQLQVKEALTRVRETPIEQKD